MTDPPRPRSSLAALLACCTVAAVGTDAVLVGRDVQSQADMVAALGLDTYPRSAASMRREIIGLEIDGEVGRVRVSRPQWWRLWCWRHGGP